MAVFADHLTVAVIRLTVGTGGATGFGVRFSGNRLLPSLIPPRFCPFHALPLEWVDDHPAGFALPVRLHKALLLLAALCVTPAHALTVEVEAPDEIKVLLMQHLETARAARLGEKLDAEEMARLQRQSELTVHDLLGTEGYFSPQVESAVERVAEDWRVDYRVVPDCPTF